MSYRFERHRLANGLTIVGEISDAAHSAAAGFFVKTGARDEASKVMGVSHFLEHMMFKGTADLAADELNRAFDEIGAKNNAYTSSEMTAFHVHTLPEHLPRGLELLSRMMRPALRQSDFDTEKGVILEEIAMYEDNPFFVLYEACLDRHFGPHPLAHRVLGTTQTITDLTSQQMQDYFTSRYAPDNTVLAISGKVDFKAACAQAEAICGGWTPTGVQRDYSSPRHGGGPFELHNPKFSRGYLLAFCEAPAIDDPRRYAASLLAQVLGAPDNSRFHWALIETGLAEDAVAQYDPHDRFGEMLLFASGDPESLDVIWSIMDRELKALRDSLTQDDLDRLMAKLATGVTLAGERPDGRMHRIGRLMTYLGVHTTLEEELDRLRRVTLNDLKSLIDDFKLEPGTVGRLLP
jgi:predicted Zn-dependent peptidase